MPLTRAEQKSIVADFAKLIVKQLAAKGSHASSALTTEPKAQKAQKTFDQHVAKPLTADEPFRKNAFKGSYREVMPGFDETMRTSLVADLLDAVVAEGRRLSGPDRVALISNLSELGAKVVEISGVRAATRNVGYRLLDGEALQHITSLGAGLWALVRGGDPQSRAQKADEERADIGVTIMRDAVAAERPFQEVLDDIVVAQGTYQLSKMHGPAFATNLEPVDPTDVSALTEQHVEREGLKRRVKAVRDRRFVDSDKKGTKRGRTQDYNAPWQRNERELSPERELPQTILASPASAPDPAQMVDVPDVAEAAAAGNALQDVKKQKVSILAE